MKFEEYKLKYLQKFVKPEQTEIVKEKLLKIVSHQNFDELINVFKIDGSEDERDFQEIFVNSISKSNY